MPHAAKESTQCELSGGARGPLGVSYTQYLSPFL